MTQKKMRSFRFAFVVFVLSAAIVRLIDAVPIPTLDLDKLTNDATLIALGGVTAVQETGTEDVQFNDAVLKARLEVGVIHVDHFLKGTAPSNTINVQFHLPEAPIGWGSVKEHMYGVFFLKPDLSGKLEFANLYYPSVPSIQGEPPTGDAPIDRVISAVSNILKSAGSTPNQKMEAVFLLSRSKSPASLRALRTTAMNDPSPEVRLGGAGVLLEKNDTSGLNFAVSTLLHGSHDTSDPLYHNVVYAISEGVKDPHAIPALKQLLSSRDPEVRRAATSALIHTQSSNAIGLLLSTLEDSDFKTRYYSAVGLAEITGQMEWRPNEDEFRTNQAKYLKHWREWPRS